jgi:glucosamine-6-phosphate deaminase
MDQLTAEQLGIKELHILPTQDEAAHKAAEIIANVVHEKPVAAITYATGSTMIPVYAHLAKMVENNEVAFTHSIMFHLDEYWPADPEIEFSFGHYLEKHLLNPLKIPDSQQHLIRGLQRDGSAEADRYEAELSQHQIDLVILGVGPGGHIGFNERGTSFASRTHVQLLDEETVARDQQERGQDTPVAAITQGIGNILEGKQIVLIAYGAKKGEILKEAFFEPVSEKCPASALRTVGHKVTLVMDQECADEMMR